MWFGRMVRGIGWGRNPLRRTSDRIEGWLTVLLIAAMLGIGPWAASRAASMAYREDIRVTAWEAQHRFQADAVLLEDARPDSTDTDSPPPGNVPATAQWTDRDAIIHTGTILALTGTRAGTAVRIWIDDRGLLSSPPTRRSPRPDAAIVAFFTLTGIAAGLAGVRRIIRWQLDRRRMRAWQLEWMTVGPGWSRRR